MTMRFLPLVLLPLLLAGCAAQRTFDEGRALVEAGNVEAGLAKIDEAARLEPSNRAYRQYHFMQRDLAIQRQLAAADTARMRAEWEAAEAAYRRILALDAGNARARTGIESLQSERRHRELLREADEAYRKDDLAGAHARVRRVLSENGGQREAQQLLRRIEQRSARAAAAPQLAAALKRPVTLEFRDASLRQVFELLSKNTGLNFIFDRDVRADLRTTVFVRNTPIEEVMRFVLVTSQLERKVLNENTVLVYPNTQAKQRDYQELVVKTFYLTNVDAKQMANTIRTLVKTKDLVLDEKLNLLVMRDTPDAVRMAERLVANQDLADPEVMLEVEVLEVSSSVLQEIGIRYPERVSYSIVGTAGTPGTVTLPEWLNRDSNLVRLSISDPFLILNLKDQTGRTNLLANPRIRVKSKEKAKVHIGDKVPVITNTSTSTGFVAESVNYLDVGLKLDVEPIVTLDDEVGIKVGLEVSSIVREIKSTAGTLTYQIGTRNASTTLRLKDGETQVLAGLISDEDRKTANQIPGLGNLPLVGRLFGSRNDTLNKTEIVLLITPRIVRNLARPDVRLEEFASGTEGAIGVPPLLLQSVPLAPGPQAGEPQAAGASAATNRLLLSAPASIAAGQEFTLTLTGEMPASLRGGLVDFAFDPSRLKFVRAEPGASLAAAGPELSFRSNAPESLGRLNLSFSSKTPVQGGGELARITLQVLGTAAGAPTVRVEAASFTDAAGKVLGAQLPPPFALSLTR